MKKLLALVVMTAALAFLATWAQASSSYLTTFNTTYGTAATALNSCNLCHTNIPTTNSYGSAFAANGHNFVNIQNLDSDGDGFTNIAEITALTFPGDASSFPTTPPPPPPPPGTLGGFSKAVYANGFWYLDLNGNGKWDGEPTDKIAHFGFPGAIPVGGDWTGNGSGKVGVYTDGYWFLDLNGNGAWDGEPTDKIAHFGFPGAIPVVGDWNGNGTAKIGVYAGGAWYLDMNGNGVWDGEPTDRIVLFGGGRSTPVVGDWNGNGTAKVGVYDSGAWYLDMNGNGTWDGPSTDRALSFSIGTNASVTPVVGDWNGSGITRVGIYQNGTWYVDSAGAGVFQPGLSTPIRYGFAGAIPVTAN